MAAILILLCSMRVTCVGGQSWEVLETDAGVTQIALQTVLDSGAANYQAEVISDFCSRWVRIRLGLSIY